MAVQQNFRKEAYGRTNPLQQLANEPIVSQRPPTTLDRATIGMIWVSVPDQAYYVLTSQAGGVSTWTAQTSGAGVFPSVEVTGASSTALLVDSGGTSLGGILGVTGASTFTGNATFNGSVTANGAVSVSSNSAISLNSNANANPSILLQTNGGTTEVIELNNEQGTSSSSILLNSVAGGVNVVGAAGVAVSSTNAAISVASGTGTVTISNDAAATTVDVATGAGAKTLVLGSTNSTSGSTLQSGSTGISINSHNGVLTAISGTGALSISNDAAATTVNIATGAAAKELTLGSTNSTSASTLQAGSGGVSITGTNGAVTVISGTGALAISNDAAATTISIGTGAAAKSVTLGSSNSTSGTTVQSGSSGISINSNGGSLSAISGTGALSISNDAAATTINIGTGAAVKTLVLGSTNTTSISTLQSGSGGIVIASGTGALAISADAAATTVSLGTGAAAKAVTVGSTNTTSSTIIQAGSGSVKISGGRIQTLTAAVVTGASPYTALSSDNFIQVDPSAGTVSILLPNAPSTGRIYTVKDSTGAAATHNITVTTVGGAVNIDGATSATISANYGKLSVIFNGTAYLTF